MMRVFCNTHYGVLKRTHNGILVFTVVALVNIDTSQNSNAIARLQFVQSYGNNIKNTLFTGADRMIRIEQLLEQINYVLFVFVFNRIKPVDFSDINQGTPSPFIESSHFL